MDQNALFGRDILTVRIHAGFNAASFLAGLMALTDQSGGTATLFLRRLFPTIPAEIRFEDRYVNDIAGVTAKILTQPEHPHRTPGDIAAIYAESRLSDEARQKAAAVWKVLSEGEAGVHGMPVEHVHFHEVGRMANVLAVGLIAEWMTTLRPARLVVSPIPLGDGAIQCAHGTIPYPAPALFSMLDGVPVRAWAGEGEAVTPTGLAVIKGLGAEFGGWPAMTITKRATVFTDKYFENVPNGALFALGTPYRFEDVP